MNRSKWVAAVMVIVGAFVACGKAPSVCDPDSLLAKAQLCADRDSLGFAQEFNQGTFIGQTAFENLQLRNGGVADLNVSSVALTGDSAFSYRSSWAEDFTRAELPATTIKGNKTAIIEVTFKPTQAKLYTATLTVKSDAQNEAEKTFTITGCGVPTDGGTSPCYCRPANATCAQDEASRCCSGVCTAGNTCQ